MHQFEQKDRRCSRICYIHLLSVTGRSHSLIESQKKQIYRKHDLSINNILQAKKLDEYFAEATINEI